MVDFYTDHGNIDVVMGKINTDECCSLDIPDAGVHKINGLIVIDDAVRFGADLYAVNSYMRAESDGTTCSNGTSSMRTANTTFPVSGIGAGSGSDDCDGKAIQLGVDQNKDLFTIRTSRLFSKIAVIGHLDPPIIAGAVFKAGAWGSEVIGALYFSSKQIMLSNRDSVSGYLQPVGVETDVSDGTSIASECNLPQAGGGRVVLLR